MPELVFNDFRAGLWIVGEYNGANQPNQTVPPNALTRADNVEYLDSGGVRGRRGWVRYDESLLGGPIVGLHRHYPRNGPQGSGRPVTQGQNFDDGGTTPWADPSFTGGREVDAFGGLVYARCFLVSVDDTSQILRIADPYKPGREVMGGLTVTGIEVRVHRRCAPVNQAIRDQIVQFRFGGDYVGENKADLIIAWQNKWETKVYGGPGDLWGYNWTPGDLNDNTFELWIKVETQLTQQEAQIEFIELVAYATTTLPATFIVASRQSDKVLYHKPTVDGGGSGWSQIEFCDTDNVPNVPYEPPLETTFRPRFVSWLSQNRTYIWDGANQVHIFDGECIRLGPGDAPHGPYAWLWKSRLWATDPNELSFSVYASGVNDPNSWDLARSQLSVADTEGGQITGGIGFEDRNIIFKNSGLWSFIGDIDTGGQLRQYTERGCVAPESIAASELGVFYVGVDGVYLTDGQARDPIEVSSPIRPVFVGRGAPVLYRNAIGTYYPFRRQYWLQLDPSIAEGWVCHILRGEEGPLFAWSYVPNMGIMNAGTTFSYSPDSGELLFGSLVGRVYTADAGNSDDGEPIAASLRTSFAMLARNGVHGRATHLKAIARHQAQLINVDVRYDEDASTTIDVEDLGGEALLAPEIQYPRAWVPSLSQFGHHLAVGLANLGDASEFELHEIRVRTALRTTRRWLR